MLKRRGMRFLFGLTGRGVPARRHVKGPASERIPSASAAPFARGGSEIAQLAFRYFRTNPPATASATPVNTARPALVFTFFSARVASGTTAATFAACTIFFRVDVGALRLAVERRVAGADAARVAVARFEERDGVAVLEVMLLR